MTVTPRQIPVNQAALAEWTAANQRARAAYATRNDELDRLQAIYERRLAVEQYADRDRN